MPLFLILRYFGPNLVVLASDGLLGALWRLFPALLARSEMGGCKIAHSVVIGSSEAFFASSSCQVGKRVMGDLPGQHIKKARQNRVEGSAVPVGGGKSWGVSEYDNGSATAGNADEHTEDDFLVGMLAQNHACRADATAEEDAECKPVDGIEVENDGEGEEHADDTARGSGMGGNLDPVVHHSTDDLYEKCGCHNGRGEVGHVEGFHDKEQCRIADDADGVGHVASFATAHLVLRPTVDAPVDINQDAREKDGEEIYQEYHGNLVTRVQCLEIAEHQEHDEGYRWHVEGREDP